MINSSSFSSVNRNLCSSRTRQRGFNIVELLISLTVGLFLLAGVLSVFVSLKSTSEITTGYGELQENGRFAISLLSDDLSRQDFWGDYSGVFGSANLSGGIPAAPANDCVGEGINNATFPGVSGHFRTLWGVTADADNPLGCFAGASPAADGSDVIQIKRTISQPVTAAIAGANDDNYYLVTNMSEGSLIQGGGAIPTIENSQIWEYQHHVYYVTEQAQGDSTVPVLMQGRLTDTMAFAPIVDGIEIIRFMYGVDTDDDGIVNAFIAADNMTQAFWNGASGSKIIAIKVYVLARSILPDVSYTDENTYTLGDLQFTPNDNFRRLLFSSTVTLFNARVDVWPP